MPRKSKSVKLYLLRIFGACMLIAGIILIFIRINGGSLDLNVDGWYEDENGSSNWVIEGVAFIFFGIIEMVFGFIPHKEKAEEDPVKYVMDTAETKLGDLSQEEKKPLEEEKTNICSYCGKQAKDTESQCSGCGANLY